MKSIHKGLCDIMLGKHSEQKKLILCIFWKEINKKLASETYAVWNRCICCEKYNFACYSILWRARQLIGCENERHICRWDIALQGKLICRVSTFNNNIRQHTLYVDRKASNGKFMFLLFFIDSGSYASIKSKSSVMH